MSKRHHWKRAHRRRPRQAPFRNRVYPLDVALGAAFVRHARRELALPPAVPLTLDALQSWLGSLLYVVSHQQEDGTWSHTFRSIQEPR